MTRRPVRRGRADPGSELVGGGADVAAGSGAGRPANVRVYLVKGFGPGGGEPAATELDPFGGAVLADGVYVG